MTPATRVLVLRHGQSEWNAARRWQGQADIALTDLGLEQARRAADKLGSFAAIASSDLERARMTAEIIAGSLGMSTLPADPRFRETRVGEWQGLTADEIETQWPGYLDSHMRPPGFEDDASIIGRVGAALGDLARAVPGEEVHCVAHAGVLRVMRRHLGVPDRRIPNLGGCHFTVHGGDATRIEVGEIVELFEHGEIGEEL
ncbi:MAG: histidine phosphatase family protein [Actinomycetota bacterium]